MASATPIIRLSQVSASGLTRLVVACGLLASGCGQPPAPSPGPKAAVSRYDSLLLFPTGPDFKLSADAAATLPPPLPASRSREKAWVGGSSLASVTGSWPRRTVPRFPAAEPGLRPPVRMAERLDPGSTMVR